MGVLASTAVSECKILSKLMAFCRQERTILEISEYVEDAVIEAADRYSPQFFMSWLIDLGAIEPVVNRQGLVMWCAIQEWPPGESLSSVQRKNTRQTMFSSMGRICR